MALDVTQQSPQPPSIPSTLPGCSPGEQSDTPSSGRARDPSQTCEDESTEPSAPRAARDPLGAGRKANTECESVRAGWGQRGEKDLEGE